MATLSGRPSVCQSGTVHEHWMPHEQYGYSPALSLIASAPQPPVGRAFTRGEFEHEPMIASSCTQCTRHRPGAVR